ncbi:MAG: LysM domain-containing protein, partial [Thermodesulfobacteriota bacterium]|nr:LysM domain-containing protein [Thermodesulfobacteriota bacterium]
MRVIAIIILSVLFFGPGCSGEEEPAHLTQKPKVVKPIIRPASTKSNTPVSVREVKTESGKKKAARAQSKTVKKEALNKQRPIGEMGEKTLKEEAGYYIVKKGDTLSSISGREDVYRDPLKWPILYRLNMDRLNKIKTGEDFPEKKLPAGVRLKIITQKKAKENRKK